MNKFLLSAVLLAGALSASAQRTPFCKAFEGKFLIGTAVNTWQTSDACEGRVRQVINNEFNAVVAENCMKGEVLQPTEGMFDFREADRLVAMAKANGQVVTGHCLVWHSQAPKWMFTNDYGQPVSKEVLAERMRKHILTVVGRYKGQIKGWDVINEAIEGNGGFRRSPYYNILGEDYFEIAFRAAHEADPDAELYYNDYGMDSPAKRNAVVALVKKLKEKGCRIDGIGMQSHVAFDTNLKEYEKSIEAFAATGCKVMVTELDLSVLPWPKGNQGAAVETHFEYQQKFNPYANGLSKDMAKQYNDFMESLFDIYLRHADSIDRVTFWGVSDGDSWKNNWPINGRTDYPLAFDRQMQPKGFVEAVCKKALKK